ncbi:MAG: class I SAM-dependent methyltransferase [Acidobacteria bacterium]|nr:class I SAM-dependent methyltransferase [Acidobacteriota bacterium]
MTQQISGLFAAFQCSICGTTNPSWTSSNHADHLFGSPGRLTCLGCGTVFPVRSGYLDLHPGEPERIPPIQHLMQFEPIVAVYEGLWRPVGYFIASKHSFPKDADRIASFIQHRNGMILDLACGPGNLTRRIARMLPDSTVIGFDLSHQMLERAVRLTQKERLRNVYYMRGSALSLPFKAESFDAVSCAGALQLFQDQDQAVGEIARVLKPYGDFVCQTTLGPRTPPLWIRAADRILKFGYFYLDDLKERLYRFNFDLQTEERSNINYIFRAAKSG